ncbi:hypothetical protein CDD83_5834 [Cordyceps sp. RAO-2017]|nr:hypothetical protein CDD83_5834 [Cordyceps sp. RAO-2017]
MTSSSKKRKLLAAVGPAPKRSKSQTGKTATSKSAGKKPVPQRIVDASALAWRQFDEEFGGLEVVSGVSVVKNGDQVQFTQRESDKDDGGGASSQEPDEESFEGFGDDAVEGQDVGPGQAGCPQASVGSPEGQEKAADKGKGKPKKKGPQQKGGQATVAAAAAEGLLPKAGKHGGSNSFGALADMSEVGEGNVDVADWVALKLSPRILSAIARLGFARPTAIQKMAIPEIIAGEDVIGKAQTGSGKTLSFGIPIVERWLETREDGQEELDDDGAAAAAAREAAPLALVLSPTRELAKQLGDHLKALCDDLAAAPYVCVVTGGLSVQKQQRQLAKADIVIGTPGRLWELMDGDAKLQETLTRIRFLVVDEADRLFTAGQFQEAQDIIGALDRRDPDGDAAPPTPRQTLIFSATFDKNLQTKLAGRGRTATTAGVEDKMAYLIKCLHFRREPKFLDANPVTQMAERLREGLIECGAMEKDLYLYTVLLLNPGRRTLVFTNSISAVRRLTPLLQNLKLEVLPLHSQMAQKARLRSLERFAELPSSILVATDVAARGLDIHEVDQVLHYHVPRTADTYVHRSGRTARGEHSGVSIILCSPDEVMPTRRLAAKVHAERRSAGDSRQQHMIQALPVDRKIASRLRPRVELSKRLADAVLAKEKAGSDDAWLRAAAEELGVEYDADEFESAAAGGSWGGRGGGRKRKEKEARALSKAEMGALRAQLREELGRRVNLGVSERYITGGRVDVGALLRERNGAPGAVFLGGDDLGLGLL